MRTEWKSLSKQDTGIFKGMAILMIAAHNFMHLFPSPKENEFEFSSDSVANLFHLLRYEPENVVQGLLSYFGHFGVQVFIFLSAYGLTKKYFPEGPQYFSYLKDRLLKIYPSFVLAMVFWAAIVGWLNFGFMGPFKLVYWCYYSLLMKMTLLSNFFMEESLALVGPWWFVSFIFQFYLLFPFLLRLHVQYGAAPLVFLSALSLFISGISPATEFNIYFTVVGHLPELSLGMYMATRDTKGMKISAMVFVISAFVFALGNFYAIFWLFNHLTALVLLLSLFSILNQFISRCPRLQKGILLIGALSMEIFLVNGFLREPFLSWAIDANYWFATIALCGVSLAFSLVVSYALAKSEAFCKKLISRREFMPAKSLWRPRRTAPPSATASQEGMSS